MYAIICNARKGHSLGIETLALVDRNKRTDLWWISDDPSCVMDFKKYEIAKSQLKRLKYNNARIVHIEKAKEILEAQQNEIVARQEEAIFNDDPIEDDDIMDFVEWGWDGHKEISGTGD